MITIQFVLGDFEVVGMISKSGLFH
jgi:hypothetical protein